MENNELTEKRLPLHEAEMEIKHRGSLKIARIEQIDFEVSKLQESIRQRREAIAILQKENNHDADAASLLTNEKRDLLNQLESEQLAIEEAGEMLDKVLNPTAPREEEISEQGKSNAFAATLLLALLILGLAGAVWLVSTFF